jgi:hypothetical protein
MWTKLIMFAVTSGLAAKALRLWMEREHERRLARERLQARQALQRWEDEGGTLRPAPAAPAQRRRVRAMSGEAR